MSSFLKAKGRRATRGSASYLAIRARTASGSSATRSPIEWSQSRVQCQGGAVPAAGEPREHGLVAVQVSAADVAVQALGVALELGPLTA